MPIQKLPGTAIEPNTIAASAISATVSFGPKITAVTVTDNTYTNLDDTAVSVSGGYIKITGTGFASGCTVIIGTVAATSVSFISSTEVRAQVPAQAAGTYIVYLTNPDGGLAIRVNALNYSSTPTWSTTSPLTSGTNDTALSIQLLATSNSTVTYALQAGSTLPAGLTLSNVGLLSGTVSGLTVETTYNFTVVATDAELQDTPQAFSITISVGDTNFKNVTVLLSADNPTSTFVSDASTNNLSLSINGDVRPNNFNPYTPGYYSNYFDGTGDYLSAPYNSAYSLTGDFTIEFWVNYSNHGPYGGLVCNATSGNPYDGWQIVFDNTTDNILVQVNNNTLITSSTTLSRNVWNHVAFVRNGSGCSLYFNGVSVGSATSSATFNSASASLLIGIERTLTYTITGFVSNVRIVKGTAVYTSNFTPPTSPLTAIANTSLLTCQSNRFIDNSTNAFTITRNGDTQISGFDPFAPDTSYSTYGSGYFDGGADYLTIPSSSNLILGGQSFTLEAWIYVTSSTEPYQHILKFTTVSGPNIMFIDFFSGVPGRIGSSSGATTAWSPSEITINTWHHVAIVRNGTSVTSYLNGVGGTPQTLDPGPTVATSAVMGWDNGSGPPRYFSGYISNFRIVRGTAVYTSNFTPPTAPLTAIANTQLLILQNNQPWNNNMFLDSSTNNFLITRNGNATQGSFNPYGGGWSNYFDGNGDNLLIAANEALRLVTGSFTIECWFYTPATIQQILVAQDDGGTGSQSWQLTTFNNKVVFTWFPTSSRASYQARESSSNYQVNSWNHVAVVYNSATTTLTVYLNGTSVITESSPTFFNGNNPTTIGCWTNNTANWFTGYISNVRLVKGTAVYTSNFTPSTTPLTPIAGTSLLTCADNRFVDDSANNFTITRNGDVSVQRFSPFSPTLISPNGYSGYFDGTGDSISISSSAIIPNTQSTFTTEGWLYMTANPVASGGGNIVPAMFGDMQPAGVTHYLGMGPVGAGPYYFGFYWFDSAGKAVRGNTTLSLNTWYHLAVSVSSNTIKLFVNGVEQTLTGTTTLTNRGGNSGTFALGNYNTNTSYIAGYVSNLRVVNGTALYTGAFTPSTSPLTAVSGTSLLTCQNNRFIDNSTNNFTITAAGNSQPAQFNPFGWTTTTGSNAAYSVTNYGGSMYFDGTGDTINLASSTALLGSGNFTVEFWVNITTAPTGGAYFTCFAYGSTGSVLRCFVFDSSGTRFGVWVGATNIINVLNTATIGQWAHVALVRVGSTLTAYINGTSVATASDSTNYNTGQLYIASQAGSSFLPGYISNFRIVTGQALYTSNFAPLVSPLSFNANTTLQVNGTGAAIYDSSMIATYETVGNAISSIVQKKYGSSSIAFDGTGDYLLPTAHSPLYAFGASDFTVEFWYYSNNTGSQHIVYDSRPLSTNGAYLTIYKQTGNVFAIYVSSAARITGTAAIAASTWYHIAVCRSGTSTRLFVNGTQDGSTYTDTNSYLNGTNRPTIGGGGDTLAGSAVNGYIDDLRVTHGVARYTANFTPPTSPHIKF